MKKIQLVPFFFLLVSSLCFGFDEDQNVQAVKDEDIPAGMEAVQVTPGYRMIVPEGAKTRRVGAQIIVEGDKEYYSRRFHEISQDIEGLQNSINTLTGQVEVLKDETKEQKQFIGNLTDQLKEQQEKKNRKE